VLLTYYDYLAMGGELSASAFALYERQAENYINSQAAGKTGLRISKLTEFPQAIKDCVFDLIRTLSSHAEHENITSASQSSGGVSESYSYKDYSVNDVNKEMHNIIDIYFYGNGLGELLYRGVTKEDVK
jgi:hypothetical protein